MDGHDNDRWIDGWSNMTLSLGAKSYLKAAMRKSNFFGQLFVRIGYEQKNRYASKRCFSTQQKKGRDFFQMLRSSDRQAAGFASQTKCTIVQ